MTAGQDCPGARRNLRPFPCQRNAALPNDQPTPAGSSRLERMALGLYRDLQPHLSGLPWPEFRRLLVVCLRQALSQPPRDDAAPPANHLPPS